MRALFKLRLRHLYLVVLAGFLFVAHVQPVLAHPGEPLAPHDLWSAWSWEPALLTGLALCIGTYGYGVSALWQRAGFGRGLRRWQVAAFGVGWITLWIALVSPLDALGSVLFSAHMLQHLLLILAAPPLLILGAPHIALIWALPRPARRWLAQAWRRTAWRTVWQTLSQPVLVWGLAGGTFWLWHVPSLYQAALQNEGIHALEHITFLGTAVLFWWTLLHPGRRLSQGAGILFVFTTMLQNGLLGALLTFASYPWYPAYANRVAAWGLTPLEDQQLAGLIMWIPAGVVYLLTALAMFALWLRTIEREMQRRENQQLSRPSAEAVRS